MDDLDRARLQDFYDELERFRAVFAKAQALVAPMIGEDAGRLEAMGKAIRKLYGPGGGAADGARGPGAASRRSG